MALSSGPEQIRGDRAIAHLVGTPLPDHRADHAQHLVRQLVEHQAPRLALGLLACILPLVFHTVLLQVQRGQVE